MMMRRTYNGFFLVTPPLTPAQGLPFYLRAPPPCPRNADSAPLPDLSDFRANKGLIRGERGQFFSSGVMMKGPGLNWVERGEEGAEGPPEGNASLRDEAPDAYKARPPPPV